MEDLVSVIIPVYNREQVLEECVDSVLHQTHALVEIILIDDGSTDGTRGLCQTLALKDERIIYLEAEHGGVSAARNIGLAHANGAYVFFLDSDDVIHPQLLEALTSGMKAYNAAISGTEVANVHERNWHKAQQTLTAPCHEPCLTFVHHAEALRKMLCENCPLSMIGGVMMRRDLIGDTRFRTDLFIGEDFYFIYENMLKSPDAVFLKQRWYYGRIHANNSSWSYDYKGFWTRFHRRKLVWESEDAHGRTHHAAAQKANAFSVYLNCSRRWPKGHPERKEMDRVIRAHRSAIFPALGKKEKLRFLLAVYLPSLYDFLKTVWHKIK